MSRALAVFAKRPIPGEVKTRLTPALSPQQAAGIYWAMVQDTWALVSELANVEPYLFVDWPWEGFKMLAADRLVAIQQGSDLGDRMYSCLQLLTEHNFRSSTEHNFRSSVVIGTDSPTLPRGHIQAAFDLLEANDDAVLGPAEDGGYYLVGCRRPHPKMFNGVSWSSRQTLAQTRSAFDAAGYRTHLTPLWRDVDDIDDLRRLAGEPVGPAVRAWLDQNPLENTGREVPRSQTLDKMGFE